MLSDTLVRIDLTHSLSDVQNLTRSTPLPSIPPEIIDYVDEGRNPDIYTREFVELVQRGNAVINGKRDAYASFSRIFAERLVEESRRRNARKDPALAGGVDLEKEVSRIMASSRVAWKPALSTNDNAASTIPRELTTRNGSYGQQAVKQEANGDQNMEAL